MRFDAHGFVDAAQSAASVLALSADADGRYALSAADLRGLRLREHPVVVLGACHAATSAPYAREAWNLPMAFVRAGARVVLASSSEISDAEAGPFFDAVLARIRGGAAPSVALRDERAAWLARDPKSWVANVIDFERVLPSPRRPAMSTQRIAAASFTLALLAGCSAAPGEDSATSNQDLGNARARGDGPGLLSGRQRADVLGRDAGFLDWFLVPNTTYTDASNTTWYAFAGVVDAMDDLARVVWVSSAQFAAFECMNLVCVGSFVEGGAVGQGPGGGTRLGACGSTKCMYVAPAPAVCVPPGLVGQDDGKLTCTKPSSQQACTALTPVGGGVVIKPHFP